MSKVIVPLFIMMLWSTLPAQSPTYSVVYAEVGGTPLNMNIYLPSTGAPPCPAVVWIHGGGWHGGSYESLPSYVFQLLGYGIAIAAVQYRKTSEAGLYGDQPVVFPAQIHDVKGAVRFLKANGHLYGINGNRLGAWGTSSGGHLAALLGTSAGVTALEGDVGGNITQSSNVIAVAEYFGHVELLELMPDVTYPPGVIMDHDSPGSDSSRYIGFSGVGEGLGVLRDNQDNTAPPFPELMEKITLSNSINHITPQSPPFFVYHGTEDTMVPIAQSDRLVAALQANGIPVTYEVHPYGHGHPPAEIPVNDLAVAHFFDHLQTDGIVVTVSSATEAFLNVPFDVAVAFSQPLADFDENDISFITGTGTVSHFTGSGDAYSFKVNPTSQGTVSLQVPAGAASGNEASNILTRTFDTIAPGVTLSSSVGTFSNVPFSVTAHFSEAVIGFVADDVAATSATIGSFSALAIDEYSFIVTPLIEGPISVTVAEGVAQDAATNQNQATSNTINTIYDASAPGVTLSSTVGEFTKSAFGVTALFSEGVSGFTAGDVTATSATIGSFNMLSADQYTFTVTPLSEGHISVSIAEGVATDPAMNGNTASTNTIITTFDNSAPTASLQSASTLAVAAPFSGTFTNDDGGGSGVILLEISARKQGNVFSDVVPIASPWSYMPTEGSGEYWIGIIATDAAGNTSSALNEVYVVYNAVANGALSILFPHGGTQSSIFPMESDLNITIELSGLTKGGLLTVARLTGDIAPAGLAASNFIDQAIVITKDNDLTFATANVIVDYNEALLGGFEAADVTTAYRDDNGTISSVPVTVDTEKQTFSFNTEGFSTWYFGPANSSVHDWMLLGD